MMYFPDLPCVCRHTLCMRYSPGAQNMDLMPRLMLLMQPWLAGSNSGRLSTSRCRCIAMSPCISSGNSRITCKNTQCDQWLRYESFNSAGDRIYSSRDLQSTILLLVSTTLGLGVNQMATHTLERTARIYQHLLNQVWLNCQNLYLALVNMDTFQMTLKLNLFTANFQSNLCYNIVSTFLCHADMQNVCRCM